MLHSRCNVHTASGAILLLVFPTVMHAASLKQVRALYREKAYGEARSALAEELPRLSGKLRNEGLLLLACLETGVGAAEGIYREIIASGEPRYAFRARLELARIHYATGQYERAVELLSTIAAAANSSDRLAALYLRSLCRKQLGEISKAREDLLHVDRGTYLYWAYMTLGELDMQEGNITGAIERFETIAGSHYSPIAGFKLGECYEIAGERERALDVYGTLITRFPRSLEAPKAREKIQMIHEYATTKKDRRERQGGDEGGFTEDAIQAGASGIPEFTLQFGAFQERENALRFAEELKRTGGNCRIERFDRDGQTWHRVRAGRYKSRYEAEMAAKQLQDKTGFPSTVLPLQ